MWAVFTAGVSEPEPCSPGIGAALYFRHWERQDDPQRGDTMTQEERSVDNFEDLVHELSEIFKPLIEKRERVNEICSHIEGLLRAPRQPGDQLHRVSKLGEMTNDQALKFTKTRTPTAATQVQFGRIFKVVKPLQSILTHVRRIERACKKCAAAKA